MSKSALTLTEGRVGLFFYELRNDAGEVIDASAEHPMAYLHGANNIIDGLEAALEGKSAGDEVDAVIAPEDGYGLAREDAVQSVHRNNFPKDMELSVGMPLQAEGDGGKRMTLWVTEIQGARVKVTSNHPLAGVTLHFHVKVAEVREASAEELVHKHVHGPGGHQH